ncbi:A24 family peptidase [Tistrella mobilis]|uniref:prepilin peptidase n=1 Tax=Tistrella mobilis TaxID=171437 RepID=UPI003558619C
MSGMIQGLVPTLAAAAGGWGLARYAIAAATARNEGRTGPVRTRIDHLRRLIIRGRRAATAEEDAEAWQHHRDQRDADAGMIAPDPDGFGWTPPASPGRAAIMAGLLAALAVLVGLLIGSPAPPAQVAILAAGCAALGAADLLQGRLPDPLTWGLLTMGLLASPDDAALGERALAAAAGFGGMWLVAIAYRLGRRRDGIGMGDVKLAAAGGAWLGAALPWGLALGAALTVALAGLLAVKVSADRRLPFGPGLAAGMVILFLAAPALG